MNTAVLEKIRKLLRLGKSANPHEASLAIARAFELARKHAIDLETVNLDDEAIERFLVRIGGRLTFERKRILSVINHFFRVEIVFSPPNVAFIGRQTDIMIAQYVHDFLLRTLRDHLRNYKKTVRRKLSLGRRKNFIQGWVYGVAFALTTAAEQMAVEDSRFALVAVEDDPRVKAARAEFYPETYDIKSKPVREDRNSMSDGWCAGKRVDIRQPLAGPARAALAC